MDNPEPRRGTLIGGCLMLLLGLPFTGIGVYMAWKTTGEVSEYLSMRGWLETPARLTRVALVSHDDGEGATYELTAGYRFEFGGQAYHGSRVSLHHGSDNIGRFQRLKYRKLKEIQAKAELFRCFVNPAQPDQSILFRELRWEVIVFNGLVLVIFGGAGLLLLTNSAISIRDELMNRNRQAHRPVARVASFNDQILPSVVCLALIWNAGALPLWWLLPREVLSGDTWAMLASPLPVLGLVLGVWAIRVVARRIRYGRSRLELDIVPSLSGGELQGVIEITRFRESVRAPGDYYLTLSCQRVFVIGEGEDISRRGPRVVWESERYPAQGCDNLTRGGIEVPVRMLVPRIKIPVQGTYYEEMQWQLALTSKRGETEFQHDFLFPISPALETQLALVRQPTGATFQRCRDSQSSSFSSL